MWSVRYGNPLRLLWRVTFHQLVDCRYVDAAYRSVWQMFILLQMQTYGLCTLIGRHPVAWVQFYPGFADFFRVAVSPAAFGPHQMGPKPCLGHTSAPRAPGNVGSQQ